MNPLMESFIKVLENDKAHYVKDFMVQWEYQNKRRKVKKDYGENVISDFFTYNGKEDIIKWMNWFAPVFPDFIDNSEIKELIQKSLVKDQEVMKKLGLTYNFGNYQTSIGLNNAQDFYIPSMLPSKKKIQNIIDFGAGYGRQANLWSSSDRLYLAVDAITSSYCLQHLYFENLGPGFTDYIDNPGSFKLNTNTPGLYHLPTWRTDLIPANSFDLALCVMVLPELNAKLVKWILGEFYRILKPGAMLYIRDNGQSVKLATSMDFDKYILDNGFSLEYQPHVANDIDIHGIPRVYRKNDPEVIKSQTRSSKQKLMELATEIDYKTGGFIRNIYKKTKSK